MEDEKRIPMSVRLTAALFILGGLHAAVDMFLALFNGDLHLNIGMVGLFIGVGLLRERRPWRTWALALIWIRLLATPISTLMLLSGDTWWRIFLFGRSLDYQSDGLWLGLVWSSAWFVISLWQYRVLTRPDVRQLFGLAPGTQLPIRRWAMLCCTIPLLFVLFSTPLGIRLSAPQAARAHPAVPREADLIEDLDLDWGKILVFEASDKIYTAACHRSAFVWRSSFCSTTTIRSDERVRTLGYLGWSLRHDRQVTFFAVQTSDPNVATIEAGADRQRSRQAASVGELVVFEWAQVGLSVNELSATALDSAGQVLYEYRYLQPTTCRDDELRWYPVDGAVRSEGQVLQSYTRIRRNQIELTVVMHDLTVNLAMCCGSSVDTVLNST